MNYWGDIKERFWRNKRGKIGACIVLLYFFIALYAPFFASSKPLVVIWNKTIYFPLLRYYFSTALYTQAIDIFFNLLSLFCPLFLFQGLFSKKYQKYYRVVLLVGFLFSFFFIQYGPVIEPAHDGERIEQKQYFYTEKLALQYDLQSKERASFPFPDFSIERRFMSPYQLLNMVVEEKVHKKRYEKLRQYVGETDASSCVYYMKKIGEKEQLVNLRGRREKLLEGYTQRKKEEQSLRKSHNNETRLSQIVEQNIEFERLENRIRYMEEKRAFLEIQQREVSFILYPLLRPLHWQDDVGGTQALNRKVSFLDLVRLTRQDLLGALLFGARRSLFVGFFAVFLSLLIGIPLGLISGYFGGKVDIVLSRFVEIWESMPAFFMLLFIMAIFQTKSLFIVIGVIALFSWSPTFRFVRAETLKQRERLYVDACRALGFSSFRILCHHLLPNVLTPVVALLPFSLMAAITREAALSFLGLGEERSCSWGQLMDEGRQAFPAEAQLLWPPALMLTFLLIAIAFVGDALRAAMDPKAEGKAAPQA